MNSITGKSLPKLILLIVFGLSCCCAVEWNSEEKKIHVEDTTPPVISNVKVFDITATSAQISWETDEPAWGQIVWDITNKISKDSKTISYNGEFTTTHRFKIAGLVPSTMYYYWTASVDANNNWKIPEPLTFTTQAK